MQESEFKKICGQLMSYYRKLYYQTTKSYQYTQRGMILKQGNEIEFASQKTLCSTTTLRQLEKGISQNNELLYFYLAQKLNKKYIYSRKYLQKIRQLCLEVYFLVEQMDLQSMSILNKKLSNCQKQQYLFYDECLQVLNALLSFYLYQELPSQPHIEQYEKIIHIFRDAPLQQMILHLICEYYRKVHYKPELVLYYLQKYRSKHIDYLYLYTIIPCLISNQQHIQAMQALNQLKRNQDFSKNHYKQFYYYHTKACILTSIDFHQAHDALEKCQKLIQNKKHLTDFHQAAFYSNLGVRSLVLHHFNEAIAFFLDAASLNSKVVPAMLPYLYEACVNAKVGMSPLQKVLSYGESNLKGLYGSYHKYFSIRCQLKTKTQALILEKYILNEILPALKIPEQDSYRSNYLRELFIKELKTLHEWTKSTKTIKKI